MCFNYVLVRNMNIHKIQSSYSQIFLYKGNGKWGGSQFDVRILKMCEKQTSCASNSVSLTWKKT